jgi:Nucleotidyl transferase AbiEii toxin, Type IV TA system
MQIPELNPFRLVGGTSLALQLGHRTSVDLDLFTSRIFDAEELRRVLAMEFIAFEMKSVSRTGFSSIIENVKCDFYNWSVAFTEDVLVEDGIRLDGLQDIAAFKLDTITGRKEKKDFIDIYYLVQKFGLTSLFDFYKRKYPYNDIKLVMDALAEIDIADASEEPVLMMPLNWNELKMDIKSKWKNFQEEKLKEKNAEREARLKNAEELIRKKKDKGNAD